MGSDMQIVVSQEQGRVSVTILHVKGEVGTHNYEQFQAQAKEAFEAGGQHILLDLTEVSYMSSAGLRAIHAIFRMLHTDEDSQPGLKEGTKSSQLKLLTPPPNVLKVIKMIGFDIFLEIYDNSEEAVASF